ncbi:hypothetical protein PsYK624_094990 [Phanerochaete sordida]|uniref:MYND-type domain-containing protein n=1 Tax=Phanerochaete sordida TaxID=48140 RepID=A0A9P3LFI8_9APHY|nr:hypothetical protein PsYK624_094990 [Phanerochaete sordida]
MLMHWLKLFPEPDSSPRALWRLPTHVIRARIRRRPALWPRLLREVCIPDEDEDSELVCTLFLALEDAIQDAPDALWRTAWQTGLMVVSAEAVGSEFLCGLAREQLVSGDGMNWMEHVYNVLSMLAICAKRASDGGRPDEIAQLLQLLQSTALDTFVKLWDTRGEFLLSEFIEGGDSTEPFYEADTVFNALNALGRLTADLLHQHGTIVPADSCIPQIFLLIWIWSSDQFLRFDALSNLGQLAGFPYTEETDPWPAVFRPAAVDDCFGNDDEIITALLRDLADEAVVNKHLSDVLIVLSLWQNACILTDVVLPPDIRLASYCLAAMRRQLCLCVCDASFETANIASLIFSNLCAGLPISARQVLVLLELLAEYALRRMQDDPDAVPVVPALLTSILQWALRTLSAPPASLSRQRAAMRTHTLEAWRAVAETLACREGADWARFARLWVDARELIGPECTLVVEDMHFAFRPLKRCAWAECLCSRHEPAHRMRMCKRCEQVVYCGERCQRRWGAGTLKYVYL